MSGIGDVRGSWTHFQQGRKGLVFDFGTNIQRSMSMFAGGLRQRENRGISDGIELELIPSYEGLYRPDLLVDPDALDDAPRLAVSDALFTHGHSDHMGEIHAMHPSIVAHCTRATAGMSLAASVATNGLRGEITHLVEREPHPDELGILRRVKGADATPRLFRTVDGAPTRAFRAMWAQAGSDEGLEESPMVAAGVPFLAHKVDHSCEGAVALELLSCEGNVVHMGDLRNHGRRAARTERLVCHLEDRGVRAMILDGTRLGREDDERVTEAQCAQRILLLAKTAGRRLVIASVGANHLERLQAFLAAAEATRRTLVVSPRVMLTIESVSAADPTFDRGLLSQVGIYDGPMGSRPRWHREIRERLHGRLVTPAQLRKDPSRYVLSHSYMRSQEWVDENSQHPLVGSAGSAEDTDTTRNEHSALGLWASMYGMSVEGIGFQGRRCAYDPRMNPSGHLHEKDIREIVDRTRPELLIPVHCAEPELFREFVPKGTRLVLPQNGRSIWL